MEFKRNTRKLRALSMISLIDIVFTIILFFLVAGHMEKYSVVAVDLPHADSGQKLDQGPIVVTLGKYGEVAINEVLFEGAGIGKELKRQFAINPERIISIKADMHLEANKLVDFLETVRTSGGKNLSIATDAGPMQVKS